MGTPVQRLRMKKHGNGAGDKLHRIGPMILLKTHIAIVQKSFFVWGACYHLMLKGVAMCGRQKTELLPCLRSGRFRKTDVARFDTLFSGGSENFHRPEIFRYGGL